MTIQFNTPVSSERARSEVKVQGIAEFAACARGGFYNRFGKPVFDCALIVLSLPVVLPLILIAAFFVALDGGSPFYWQKRLGRDGCEFRILKLRTMILNADEALESYLRTNPKARREWDEKQKLCYDPRVTKIGRILRKTSMDELPQLWNVLRGDMSLVGPRPMMVDQQDLYPGLLYYRMRPGITGLWQVSDRNETSFADRASYDSEYFAKLSFGQDVALLIRTVGVVLRGTGY